MTVDAESPRPWVEVLDMTFVFGFAGPDGKPARLTYTIKDHEGDVVKQLPGGFKIQRPAKDVEREGETYRVKGEDIFINAGNVVAIENIVRLERRERLSAKEMIERSTIDDAETQFRKAQERRGK